MSHSDAVLNGRSGAPENFPAVSAGAALAGSAVSIVYTFESGQSAPFRQAAKTPIIWHGLRVSETRDVAR